jgi:transcriptional regulator with XRE-family HTH domain
MSMSLTVEKSLAMQLARSIRERRDAKGLSLDGLATKSQVSRSMISLIERGESSPTAAVLDKLARALGVTLASLFAPPTTESPAGRSPVSRKSDRMPWQDPESGYVRCNISPMGTEHPMQIVEVRFPAGARVSFENGARGVRVYQQIWILSGALEISIGRERHSLREGDCLAMELDQPTILSNSTRKETRYALVIVSENLPRR